MQSTTHCCHKTAVCDGDQWLDFSVPKLVWSQSTLTWKPFRIAQVHIVQFNGSSSRRLCCSVGFEIMHVVCADPVQIYFVLDYYILNSQL